MDDRDPGTGNGQDTSEQRLSDAGQTVADDEQTLAESDQTLSDRDQHASEDDQAASDLDADLAGSRGASSRATALRADATRERKEVSALRDVGGDHRDLAAKRRDELSSIRDAIAQQRDEEAAHVDAREELFDRHTLRVDELRARARASRIRAARDRERAARDRAQGARDRAEAARDREQAALEREQASTDELTGARRRGVGLEELETEIKRARRENTGLVVAYVDVDGLKAVNDAHGHAVGDEVLRSVARGLRRHMRSYDLLIRMGGDEFLCALPGVTAKEAAARFGDLGPDLNGATGNSVSVGFGELQEGDSTDGLVQRADADLLRGRGRPPQPPRG